VSGSRSYSIGNSSARAAEITASKPLAFSLEENYPNPFNPSTNIRSQIPNDGLVTLKVFNTLGQEVATLVNEVRTAGTYNEVFDASRVASGVYIYKLAAGNFSSAKKLVVVK
jgi:hypothetical protein